MVPIGDINMLRDAISQRYADYDEISFGILIADAQQSEAREYILNYIDIFHAQSGQLFDFFLPGYSKYPTYYGDDIKCRNIIIDKTSYHFSRILFIDFCQQINKMFGIKYTYNPMLILMSMRPGHLETAKYIIIELDDNDQHSIRRSGMLFTRIFDIVRADPSIQNIRNGLIITTLNGNWLDAFINSIDVGCLSEIHRRGAEIRRFRINHM